jgi:4-amino-4-deoxy-L-arabinose transferase-like glycosyltransferase
MKLAGVVLLGAALRFLAIGFGLPHPQARPDETTVLGHALAILAGDPNPHFFNWPSFTFYLLAGVFAAARSVVSTLAPSDYTLIARSCMALAGIATILVLARLARRVADDVTAMVAALLLAVATLHVRESHFALTDTLMTLLATACLALLVEGSQTGRTTLFALAGLAGGLATSTKYSAAVLRASAPWRRRSTRWRTK